MNMHDDDAILRELLRSSATRPPFEDVDWQALHAGIRQRAQPLLRPGRTAWWQLVAGWSGRGIPLGAAAAAALMIALGTGLIGSRSAPAAAREDAAFHTIEEELAAAAPLLLTDADSDQLIEAMLLYDGGEW